MLQKCNCTRPVGTKINKTMLHPDEHILRFTKWTELQNVTSMYKCNASTWRATRLQHDTHIHQSCWSTFPPLCSDQSSAGAAREAVYRRRPGLPGRRTHHLEQPTGQRDISPVCVNLPSAFKNISVPGLIPWHYHWSPVNYSPPPVDPEVILLLGPL